MENQQGRATGVGLGGAILLANSLLQVVYQYDKKDNVVVCILFVCSIIYGLSMPEDQGNPNHWVVEKAHHLVGPLVIVLQALLLKPAIGWFLFVCWVFFVVREVHKSYEELLQLLEELFEQLLDALHALRTKWDALFEQMYEAILNTLHALRTKWDALVGRLNQLPHCLMHASVLMYAISAMANKLW